MNNIISELIEFGKISGERGLTCGISGNLSARIGKKIVITSSGSANGFLSHEDFSIIDLDGNVLEGNKNPSSEKGLHIDFYTKRPDINAVFHCHSPYLTAFASSNEILNISASPEMIYCFENIPKAKYALPGSNDLRKITSKFFEKSNVVLLENHGVIVGGENVKNAFLNLELCESYAKMLIYSKSLGGARMLPQEEIKKILELKNNKE